MKKVITYGTFDLFHRGHYNILKRAKMLGDYLIVGVTSESFDIERGKIGVRDSLPVRIENVRKTGFADEIIIEEFQGQKIQDIQKYGVDILVVGSDWKGKFDYLKPYCDVVYLERTKDISSTQIRLNEQYIHVGLMLDAMIDDDFILESKYVSGIHVDKVFSPNKEIAEKVCRDNELSGFYTELVPFFQGIDAVYIHENQGDIAKHAKMALSIGKHVLCSFPISSQEEEIKELVTLARQKQVVFMPCVRMAYIQALNQMFWMIESGAIGNIIRMHCCITNEFDPELNVKHAGIYILYVYYRLFRNKENKFIQLQPGLEGKAYFNLFSKMENSVSDMEIGMGVTLPNELTILGDKGCIRVPDDWWNTGYFEVIDHSKKSKRRYSYNYEGTGMRYVLREFLIMLREQRLEPLRFTHEECLELNNLYQKIFGDK